MGVMNYNRKSSRTCSEIYIPSSATIFILLHNLSIINVVFSALIVSITYDQKPYLVENEIVSIIGLLFNLAVWYYVATRSSVKKRIDFIRDLHTLGIPLELLASWLLRLCFGSYLIVGYSTDDNQQYYSKTTVLIAGIFQFVTIIFSLGMTQNFSSMTLDEKRAAYEKTSNTVANLIKPYSHRRKLNLLPVEQKPRVGRFKR